MLSGVALITGAGGVGIGAAIARSFAKSGVTKLILTDLNAHTLQDTVASIESSQSESESGSRPEIVPVAGDISDPSFVDALFDNVGTRLDYAVNCAGISGNNRPTAESELADFDKITGVNYRGLWMCAKKELEIMKAQRMGDGPRAQRGSIVNIASQLGVVGRPDAPIYCASKSAVIGLTRCDAIDVSPYRIRVNAVSPGIILSPMTDNTLRPVPPPSASGPQGSESEAPASASASKDMQGPMDLTKAINIAPMRRMGTPEEIADIVVFLSSERASFVQGANWVADGGYTIN